MNHALKTGQRGSTRDIGLDPSMHNSAGKGDASRVSNLTRFKEHLDEVALPRVPCAEDPAFVKTKRGFKKVYGVPATRSLPEEEVQPAPQFPNFNWPTPEARSDDFANWGPAVEEPKVEAAPNTFSPNEIAPEL